MEALHVAHPSRSPRIGLPEYPHKGPYIGLQEAADYCCASNSTFRQWTRNRRLPSYKIGKRVLYKTADLDAFVEKHLRRSHEQLDDALAQGKRILQKGGRHA